MGILCARGSANPPRLLTAFWGIVSAVAAVLLLLAGGLTALEQAMVVMSAPFMIVMVILTVGLLKQAAPEQPCHGQLGLPVLQAPIPEIGRSRIADPVNRIFPLAELLAVVGRPARNRLRARVGTGGGGP